MKKLISSILALFCIYSGMAQIGGAEFVNQSSVLYNDGKGIPWRFVIDKKMDGSPFYDTGYNYGSIKILRGKEYDNLRIKIHLESNTVIFQAQNGEMLAVSNPIEYVRLIDARGNGVVFRSGFSAIDKNNDRTLYQQLDSGKVVLLKHVSVKFTDSNPSYGTGEITRTYSHSPTYYIWSAGGGITKAPTDEAGLIALFPEHKAAISEMMKKEKPRMKREQDLQKVFAFCNALVK